MVRAVFVFAESDLSVHPSLADAADSIEAIDVDNGEFTLFGEDGTLVRPEVQQQRVLLHVSDELRLSELRERLRGYLAHPRVALDPSLADGDLLVAAQVLLDEQWGARPFRWFESPWVGWRRWWVPQAT